VPEAEIDASQDAATPQTGPSAPAWGVAVMDRDAAIEAAELSRDPAASALSEAAADPARRERAMWAWGRIGGALAVDRLLERVVATDPPASSAELAAVAFLEPPAGLPGEAPEPGGAWAVLEDALWTRYALTEKDDDAVALLLAAARIGGARSQQRLAADAAVVPEGDVAVRYVAAMEAMGMLCARGYAIDRAGIDAVAHGLEGSTQAREVAAYVVGRCAGPSAELLAGDDRAGIVERLHSVIVDVDAETAALGWKALAALGEKPAAVPESILGQQPPPWQVEVEAIKALSGHAEGRRVLAERLGRFDPAWLEGTRGHPVIVALRGLRDGVVGNPDHVDALRGFAVAIAKSLDAATDRARKLPALVACELAVLTAIRSGDVAPVEACAVAGAGLPSTYGHVLAVDAIMKLADAEQRTTMLLTRADDPRAVVAEAALSALADVDDPRVNVVLRRGLERADAGVQAAAAGSIASRAADKSRRDEQAIPILGKTVRELDNGVAIEARVSAIEALGSLARSAEPPPLPKDATQSTTPLWLTGAIEPLARDGAFAVRQAARATLLHEPTALARFDAAMPESFPQGFDERVTDALARNRGATGLRIVTDAGTIEIDFTRAPAPIAQAVFADLAASGYFEGVLFHRVVPAFVVQGGDPRGDGYGGPGFVIPCERSSLRYERGAVGVALAGKDTGGSQFFIAHNREPRLDARYTIIGHVTEGMDVVDRILPYDVIERVEVVSR
jgi:cyclophilin family peptidyl-prolyl cis-trans isomerase